jgi:hypothetical protein
VVEMSYVSRERYQGLYEGILGLFDVNTLKLNSNIPFAKKKAN